MKISRSGDSTDLPTGSQTSASDDGGHKPPPIVGLPSPPPPLSTRRQRTFDLESLRLPQNYVETAGVEKHAAYSVDKPAKHTFFRVHRDQDKQFPTRVLEYGEGRDRYLVSSELCDQVATLLRPVNLRLYSTYDRVFGIWPLAIPDPLRPNRYHTSALAIASVAEERWVRMAANQHVGAYEHIVALHDLKEPTWPKASFEDILREAFKDRFIESSDHPILCALRGEIK